MENIEPGNISNENAEARANLGQQRPPSFAEAQAFDGPAPETINVRVLCLSWLCVSHCSALPRSLEFAGPLATLETIFWLSCICSSYSRKERQPTSVKLTLTLDSAGPALHAGSDFSVGCRICFQCWHQAASCTRTSWCSCQLRHHLTGVLCPNLQRLHQKRAIFQLFLEPSGMLM